MIFVEFRDAAGVVVGRYQGTRAGMALNVALKPDLTAKVVSATAPDVLQDDEGGEANG